MGNDIAAQMIAVAIFVEMIPQGLPGAKVIPE
jgi:hypothetical protein